MGTAPAVTIGGIGDTTGAVPFLSERPFILRRSLSPEKLKKWLVAAPLGRVERRLAAILGDR
jgi:hypothetical protein